MLKLIQGGDWVESLQGFTPHLKAAADTCEKRKGEKHTYHTYPEIRNKSFSCEINFWFTTVEVVE